MDNKFYDGTKLLSLKDNSGNQPEIYICESNRSAGKTTFFNRLAFNRFLSGKIRKVCFLYRFSYELSDCADKIFKEIKTLFFPGYDLKAASKMKGNFYELSLFNIKDEIEKPCGYAIALNAADMIKKYSHLFSDVDLIIFDEFQSENNHYCNREIDKFISVHTSIARGGGKQVRRVPVIMVSNPVTIINPYFTALGISDRLKSDTKFLRGNGYVLERNYNPDAAASQKQSGFNAAFENAGYTKFLSGENIYLNDNTAFLTSTAGYGKSRYLATLTFRGCDYALREYYQDGIIYCDKSVDPSFKLKIPITTEDHNINYIMLKNNDLFISSMRYYFQRGCFRFKDLNCKAVIFTLLGIS